MEENVVSYRSNSSCRRRSGQSRGRGGRYNCTNRLARKESESSEASTAGAGESSVTPHAVTAGSQCSSSSVISDHNATRQTWRRARGNRRPWRAKRANRPDFVPREPDCIISEQMEDCSSLSHLASSADGRESLDMDTHQAGNMHRGRSGENYNSGMNARHHGYGRFVRNSNSRRLWGSRQLMSWHSQMRGGCTGAIQFACKESDSVQKYQNTYSSISAADISFGTPHEIAAGSQCSSFTSDHTVARGTWNRGRHSRRPWQAKGANRQDFVSSDCERDCSSTQQVEDCSSSSHSASTADDRESLDVGVHQASNTCENRAAVTKNCGKNARHYGRRRLAHGNRVCLSPRHLLSRQTDSVSCEENEVTGSTSGESRMHDHVELDLMSNVETDEWVDDDDDGDDDDGDDDDDHDALKARNLPDAIRGKQKKWNIKAYGVHGNKTRHSRAGRFHEHVLLSQNTMDADSLAPCTLVDALAREAIIEQKTSPVCDKSGKHQKQFKQKSGSTHRVCEVAHNASISAANSGSDSATKTPAAPGVKQADFGDCGKNSSSKPSTQSHIDENSLFWHLVDEHHGKCCIEELRNQLNTGDADNAIAILRRLKRIKILINETDKWKSVAFVFHKGLRLCLHVRAGCRNKNCSFLHVCPDYVTESCLAGQQCRFGHSVRIPRNEPCLQKAGIPDIPDESILVIARSSNLMICAGHNGLGPPQCHNPDQCIWLHVCNYFFCDRCLIPNSKCVLGHELTTEHNAKLLELYEVKHLLKDKMLKTLHQMILPFNKYSVAHSQMDTSYENVSKTSQVRTKQQTAVVRPNVRTGQVREHEMKDTVTSLMSDGQLFAASAADPCSVHHATQPVTLRRFVVSPDLTSKANSAPASDPTAKLAEDTHDGCTKSESIEQPNSHELTPSTQPSEIRIAGDEAYQPPTDKYDSHMKPAHMTEPVTTVPQRFAMRRSQSAKTLEFRANQCQVYMKHLCNESNECSVRHDALPYLWRVQDAGKWVPFDDNVGIEQAFCNADNSAYAVSYQDNSYGTKTVVINFDRMQCAIGKVQRLSTASYVTCRTECDATRWCWYWNSGTSAENVWMLYEDTKSPYQDVLESKFLADAQQTCCFELEEYQYELNFTTMRQRNLRTGTDREVCRRPCFVSELDLKTGGLPPALFNFDPAKLPINEDWLPMDTETPAWTDLVPVNPQYGTVYTHVSDKFHATLSRQDYKVCKIYRVQNLDLWHKYQNMKSKMEKLPHLAGVGAKEQYFFHGTPDEATVRCICNQNFDPRMHGRHATMYGRGVYFSTTARYSDSYTRPCPKNSGHRFMFLARALVGKSAPGKQDLQRPPPVDPSRPHGALYDSCVNSTSNPTIFVIFDNDQCYPEFLIEYESYELAGTGGRSSGAFPTVTRTSALAAATSVSSHSLSRTNPVATRPSVTTSHAYSSQSNTPVPASPAATLARPSSPTSHQFAASSASDIRTSSHAAPINSAPLQSTSNSRAPARQPKSGCVVM